MASVTRFYRPTPQPQPAAPPQRRFRSVAELLAVPEKEFREMARQPPQLRAEQLAELDDEAFAKALAVDGNLELLGS